MANEKVFGSDITRTLNDLKNNLYDLIIINPAKPLPKYSLKHLSCDFIPRTDKYYIPQKKLRPKVRTVRDIRNLFEKDVYSNLSNEIEKQQNLLLRKIRGGSSKDEKTKLLAKNLLKSEKPISRTAWQIMININPDDWAHTSQYVLWNGKCIQINGSRGGKCKFIYKYDLGERRASMLQKCSFKNTNAVIKKDLLKDSLIVKFKPGPLSRKKQLDISYQKYNVGNVELAKLPRPELAILPEYGKSLDTSIANFLHNLRDINGIISDKWAEFAVSALGTSDNGCPVQLNKNSCVTFDLTYKNDQRRLLMRYDVEKYSTGQIDNQSISFHVESDETTKNEVQKMLDEMLISVEISLIEDKMYTGVDSPREVDTEDINNSHISHYKDKVKRRGPTELHRLDVTVIRLCSEEKSKIRSCQKSFCTLGCVCDSILSSIHLKKHCGRIECMFECKCNFKKYNRSYFGDDISGLVSLNENNNSTLSKEEQKFHQTVILSGEKSILLKSQRRNWKAPEKYADFYSTMCLKSKKDIKRSLSVMEIRLNCENIEPWCMIHNLYKCFCKGKFTEKLSNNVLGEETKIIESENNNSELPALENFEEGSSMKNILRPRVCRTVKKEECTSTQSIPETDISLENNIYKECARVKPYLKRKYSDTFYYNTNKKIMELEQDDHGLRKRMMEILQIDDNSDIKKLKKDTAKISVIDLSTSPTPPEINQNNETSDESKDDIEKISPTQPICSKNSGDIISTQFSSPTERMLNIKLKAWLEPSLKMYRQRFAKGFFKKSLDPPKAGKIALYPWDFIVNRYLEKKNLFLVTNQKPFRIFMAVDNRNSLFNNCININTIKDIETYPTSVKNIITNDVVNLKDQLCILRGLNICWELVGSVKKLCDRKNSESENNSNETPSENDTKSFATADIEKLPSHPSLKNNLEESKWFVMTIEDDFSEIQFYNKGFFVKYDSIIKAINVARVSDKTVRLSSQKCNDGSIDPQFGIYAIPNANEYCVFIGPYEKNESLGIETVKKSLINRKKKTRGVWITTNKVDNFRVIDNPLSFMSQINLDNGQSLEGSSQDETVVDMGSSNEHKILPKPEEINKVVKLVKPIKITKTNSFYHLTPSGLLKPISLSPEKQTMPFIMNKHVSVDIDASTSNSQLLCKSLALQFNERDKHLSIEGKQKSFSKKPIAEIAPQVKVVEENRESSSMQHKICARNRKGGMFILKPEEINSRSLINNICVTPSSIENIISTVNKDDIDMDIENFLANSVECSAPNSDVYVISDDEDYCNKESSNKNCYKSVWIICKSVKNLGWITGRQDSNGNLSFEFPGFKFTEFYPEDQAFAKISQVLARKIYIPEHVKLNWYTVDTIGKLKKMKLKKLEQRDLNPEFVLTKMGLIHKSHVAGHSAKKSKTYSNSKNVSVNKSIVKPLDNINEDNAKAPDKVEEDHVKLDRMKSSIIEMDTESNILLKEGEELLNQTILKGGDQLSDSFSKMSNDCRQKISDRLRSIISNNHCS